MAVGQKKGKKTPAKTTGTGTGTRYSAADILKHQNQALTMHHRGKTIREIAQELSTDKRTMSPDTASKRLSEAIDAMRPHADHDKFRALQHSRLNVAFDKVMGALYDWEPITSMSLMDPRGELHEVDVSNVPELRTLVEALVKLEAQFTITMGLAKAPFSGHGVEDLTDQEILELVAILTGETLDDEDLEEFFQKAEAAANGELDDQ